MASVVTTVGFCGAKKPFPPRAALFLGAISNLTAYSATAAPALALFQTSPPIALQLPRLWRYFKLHRL